MKRFLLLAAVLVATVIVVSDVQAQQGCQGGCNIATRSTQNPTPVPVPRSLSGLLLDRSIVGFRSARRPDAEQPVAPQVINGKDGANGRDGKDGVTAEEIIAALAKDPRFAPKDVTAPKIDEDAIADKAANKVLGQLNPQIVALTEQQTMIAVALKDLAERKPEATVVTAPSAPKRQLYWAAYHR